MIKQATGTDMVHVPYRGAAPAMNAMVGGEVDLFCGPLTQGLPHIRSKRLIPIGSSGTERAALTPQVPTLIEAGLKDFVMYAQYYVMAPKGTPQPIVEKIRTDLKAVLDDPEIKKIFASIGVYQKWVVGEPGAELVRRDLARWADVVKAANIKAQ
jgi:tripartite-type tricarboxylate transporter receptor subunit TctC